MNWFWLILALASVTGSGYLIGWANRPRLDPDWFWGGDEQGWVPSEQESGLAHGDYAGIRLTEPNDLQESEPTSAAD